MKTGIDRARALDDARMLVVDDEFLIAIDLESILREAGAQNVTVCTSAEQALEAADGGDFDVALLDVRLGGETSERIARHLADRGARLIFYSGQDLPHDMRRDYPDAPVLAKPTNHLALVQAVRGQLERGPDRSRSEL